MGCPGDEHSDPTIRALCACHEPTRALLEAIRRADSVIGPRAQDVVPVALTANAASDLQDLSPYTGQTIYMFATAIVFTAWGRKGEDVAAPTMGTVGTSGMPMPAAAWIPFEILEDRAVFRAICASAVTLYYAPMSIPVDGDVVRHA